MPVFDDPRKELEALQAQIEDQEDWFQRELDSAKGMIGEAPGAARPVSAGAGVPARNSGNTYAVQKTRQAVRASLPKQPAPAPKKKGIRGLVILAVLELLGIFGIVAYWLLVLLL